MGHTIPNSIADQIKNKLHYTLKAYCDLRGLNYHTLSQGYVSASARIVLETDGIDVDKGIEALKQGRSL